MFFDDKTNTTLSGVAVMISKFKDEYYEDKIFKKSNINYSYSLWVRTTAMGNSYDIEMQNNTLKECRKRFKTFLLVIEVKIDIMKYLKKIIQQVYRMLLI
ncbi:hypothetical protein [Brachyspira hyodysenteriae]|uniref:hypothetical protein n=1 Tax=Brachyspira hyodysenteriae TaxID=159 RepID=UPI0022CE034B|nr:hypothetical protein [Brachyspira hyodysenteriae]MDA0080369.1 hypothetical protein [Brachyspira hyodysenteriae]